MDIMGATEFNSTRANWDKKCCDNQRGPVIAPPRDLAPEKKVKVDNQIKRMRELKTVSLSYISHKVTSVLFILSSLFGFLVIMIFSINVVICILHPIWFLLVKYCPSIREKLGGTISKIDACLAKIKTKLSLVEMVKAKMIEIWGPIHPPSTSEQAQPSQTVRMNAKNNTVRTIA